MCGQTMGFHYLQMMENNLSASGTVTFFPQGANNGSNSLVVDFSA